MYLKELVMTDFKSFSGEVVIPFDRGFTAITGPNGSGKSNSGDAIQFVLGPRSAKTLRAQSSKDLIFNGGKHGKPARGCSVTLVFANPVLGDGRRRIPLDMDEVTMTKRVRLTPTGNVVTTYELNDEESSLKSFHQLLGAANARPDGYNIVLQGDVTNLAKMSPGERRKVLDDVAGVTSYDDEIRKAERQRKDVEDFLDRIALIEEEQRRHLKVLDNERKSAQKAIEIREELVAAKAVLWRAKVAGQKATLDHQRREIQRNLDEATALEEQVSSAAKHLLSLDDTIAELTRQIQDQLGGGGEALQAELNRLAVAVETAADRLSDLAASDEEALLQKTRLEDDLEAAKAALHEAVEALDAATSKHEQASAALTKAMEDEASVQTLLATSTNDVALLARQAKAAEDEVENSRGALANAQSDVDRSATAGELLLDEQHRIEENLGAARMALAECELQGEDLKQAAAGNDRENLGHELITVQRLEARLTEESEAVESRLRNVERELARARDAVESRSGSNGLTGGAAAVLQARDGGDLDGILGTIAELCAPKDDAHTVALSTAIGSGMMSVVVETDEVAARAIRWLKQNNAGRATFLPLNKINPGRPAGRAVMVARQAGVVGFAHDLLDHDPRIEAAVHLVLRNTLIVQDLATARANMGGVRLVTLDGSVTEAGGAMTGGAARRNSLSFGGKVEGASEVDRLSKEVERLISMSEDVNAKVRAARQAQSDIRNRLADATTNDAAANLAAWKSDLAAAKANVAREEGQLAALQVRLETFESEGRRHLALRSQAQQRLEAAIEGKTAADAALQDASPQHLRDRLHAAQMARSEANALLNSLTEAIRSSDERRGFLTSQSDELMSRLDDIAAAMASRAQDRTRLEEQMVLDRTALASKQEERRTLLEEHQGLEDERVRLSDERATLRAASEQRGGQARTCRHHAEELGRLVGASERALAELREAMLEEGVDDVNDDDILPTVAEGEQAVRRLERRIENLGSVNWLALEQYDACQARLDDLSNDNTKLKARRKDLIELAEQLDEQRTVRLKDVLSRVNENFQRVYKTLSKGGEGELFLEDPDQPFAGGLDMWARPRGKSSRCRLQGLSGGEQSMAALALIFAIQDYDPSPFYYFDEVDQNLDSDNARLIAQMCRTRSERAQFIMVTLRKVSLSLADHHIGVTHGGDGCSRRIMDFDRQRALALGAAAEEAAAADAAKNADRAGEAHAFQQAMPTVPSALGTPSSLEGLMSRAEESVELTEASVASEGVDVDVEDDEAAITVDAIEEP